MRVLDVFEDYLFEVGLVVLEGLFVVSIVEGFRIENVILSQEKLVPGCEGISWIFQLHTNS